ncbi:MAG: FecR domain-containing protein, partial [Candidatus Sericytochromatia bacterium]
MSKIFTGVIAAGIVALSSLSFQAIGDNNLHNAVIRNIKNKVELKYGASLWREASINQMVRPGTSIRTGSRSKVELMYPDGTVTRLGSRTNMTVLEKASRSVKVSSGKLWFKVAKK